ncbi:adenine deaminase [Clostridium beijerinckii]|uniref:Adenine deaminase n=2 Tax=Clostridium beijerinckii TaxID=1520 RepID=A0AB74VJT9_CLOBE|nr:MULTISPECIES: adenine deaminase [Clostridium]NRZ25834.1 adenine deaminase [Clostridium beijerinckii]NYB98350.1 adenine deaminase [Clostridium beijerinckii]OOM22170.1 adenine deaminase [Clostridium beijerinckii]QUN36572.1 adenine deaminase [Clostridium beijerinckii]SQB12705.1 adenine deaminase [Clostridium beijerinckii]
MNKDTLINHIKASNRSVKCDLVIKNVTIIDVFNKNRFVDTIGIKDGYIVGIGDYDGYEIVDGTNKYICPGLIDSHCHIESSLVTPTEYSKLALLNGITSVIADPHEISNVMGTDGINFMLNSSQNIPFDIYFMLPSCVPGTSFESSGATLLSKDLKDFYKNDKVLGLAEVMDYPSVSECDDKIIDKICDSITNNKVIDGHGAGFTSMMTNTYRTANILTDHECNNAEEALDKIRRGMYILIREGTVAKNLKELLPAVNESNSNRFCFCTDDKHIDDIAANGSINSSIIYTINNSNLNPETAIQMATLNPSLLYKLNNKGAIAPGYIADFILLDDLERFNISQVYKEGKLVVNNNELINFNTDLSKNANNNAFYNSINLPPLSEDSFKINIPNKDVNILNAIEIIPNKLESIHLKLNISDINSIKDNDYKFFTSSTKDDLLKIAVIERHKASGNLGLGILKGLGISEGAIGTTIAHDSHNLIIAGTNDKDMLFAAKELERMGGGIIVVKDKNILAHIKLEIGGLMTNRTYGEIEFDLKNLHSAIKIIAPQIDFNPFLTLSFLSLPVIPDLKITDKGLFDVINFKFIDIFE